MITIPAMHPCPELHIDADVPELRLTAHTLTLIHQRGATNPLCIQHEHMLGDGPECDAADKAFARAMSDAIDPYGYLTTYLVFEHGVVDYEAAAFRPIWAAHIARSIYEQIGA